MVPASRLMVGCNPLFLKTFSIASVLRQDLGDQLLEPGIPGDRGKMKYQCDTDPLSLVFVDQGESTARPGSTTT